MSMLFFALLPIALLALYVLLRFLRGRYLTHVVLRALRERSSTTRGSRHAARG